MMMFKLYFQGDSADCMFFVEEGEVKITVKNKVNMVILSIPSIPYQPSHEKRSLKGLGHVGHCVIQACRVTDTG